MPKIQVNMTDSEGWKPLPAGSYPCIIDNVVETLSSKNNPQLKLTGHVMQHPQYADKKITLFLPMVPQAAFRVLEVLEAVGIDFDKNEADGGVDDDGNKIAFTLSFDTDDLIGGTFLADVTVREYNGKDSNDFKNLRPIEGAQRPAAAPVQTRSTQPAQGAAVPAAGVAAAPAGDMQRRRRVVGG